MRRIAVLTVLAVSLATTATVRAQGPGKRQDPSSIKLESFTAAEKSFHSDAIGEDVAYLIYLPKGYDDKANADTKWPLIIWLHGMFEDDLRFHGRGGAPMIDAAVKDKKLPPCVFVCPNGGRTSMWVNRHDKKYEDLVTKDLLAHLAKTYRISDRRDQRAIMGISMGGMAALRIAFTQPELFGAVAVHSSAVLPEDPEQLPDQMKAAASRFGLSEVFGDPIEKEPWQKANPLCLAQALEPKALHGLRIYFDAGTNDRYGFGASNEQLHKVLDKKGIAHTWRLIEGGGHSWGNGFQGEALPYSFAAVGEMFAGTAAVKSGLEGLGGSVGGKGDDEKSGKKGGDVKKDDSKDSKKDAGHDKPDANGRSGGGR
jgi:enterochelin esterase-like enzyme